jgi:hypothetical protein
VGAAPLAQAADAKSSTAPGLYGTSDPKFDGVFRQSLAFLAQYSAGVTPAASAVDWLAGQQCADGGFAEYRADTSAACDAKKAEFTDATAAAVQGLAVVGGHSAQARKGIEWFTAHQNADGGWGMLPGSASDANSTSIAIGAYVAAGQDPAKATAKSGKSPYDALLALQVGCDAKEGERGAFAYLPQNGKLIANDLASAAGALAALGKLSLVDPAAEGTDKPVAPLACKDGGSGAAKDPAQAAEASAAYLAGRLAANKGHLDSSMPGAASGPDYGTTADAVTALAAGGHLKAAQSAADWLKKPGNGAVAWAKGDPGKLAKLVLAAHATHTDPRDFSGTDLVAQLNATGPKPESAAPHNEPAKHKKSDGVPVWLFIVIGLAFGAGIGFLLSGRNKKNQL